MTPADDPRGYNIPRPDDAIAYAARTLAGFYRPWLLAAVLAVQAGMLLAFHVSRSWHCLPDSALYLGLARSIGEGQGYTFNGEFHAMVPPLYPLALAAVTRVFGPSYLAINCFQIVLALACTPVAFGLTRRMFGRDLALVATAAFAVNMVVWDVAATPVSDLLFTLLAMLGMWAAAGSAANGRRRWAGAALAGLGLAAASLTRTNGFLIVLGAALAVWLGWRGRPAAARLAGAGLMAVLALAPVFAWSRYVAAHVSGQPVTYLSVSHLSKPLGQMIPAMAHNLFTEVFKIASNLMVGFSDVPPGLRLILPALIAVGCLVALRRREPMLPLSLAALVAALTVASGVKSRYFLFLLPGMVVLLLAGAVAVARLAVRTSPRAPLHALRAALIFLAVAAAINLGHTVSRGAGYRRGETPGGARLAHDQDWFIAARYIRDRDAGEPSALTIEPRLLFMIARIRSYPLTQGGVDLSEETYQRVARKHRPGWLVGEVKAPSTARAVKALREIGAELTPVTDARLTGALKMWRIAMPPPAPPATPATRGVETPETRP